MLIVGRTTELDAVDKVVVRKRTLRIIFDRDDSCSVQAIPLLDCSSDELEPLPVVDVVHS